MTMSGQRPDFEGYQESRLGLWLAYVDFGYGREKYRSQIIKKN